MGNHLVLVGGGHAHMTVLARLGDFTGSGHRVTVVSPSGHHYYSGMGPGLLSGIYQPREVRFNVRRMAEEGGAEFVEEDAVRIDPAQRSIILRSGREIRYDVASCNAGSVIRLEPPAAPSERIVPVKPIVNLHRSRQRIADELGRRDLRMVVVGGGAAGVEVAGNLWRLARRKPHRAEITLVAGARALASFPETVRMLAVSSLRSRKIGVIEGVRATIVQEGSVTLSDGSRLECDFAFLATGVIPVPLFVDSGLPVGRDGGLLVNACLQSVRWPELFGGGDCICLADNPLPKVGVYAVRQNPVLYHNLLAALEDRPLHPFDEVGEYLLAMNLGDGTGIAWKGERVWGGRLAFLFKELIDRRFMQKYQVSGERGEEGDAG